MTEAEWGSCENPMRMLAFLTDQRRASERKMRLFSCACCRRVPDALADERARRAVDVAERYADGLADEEEGEQALEAVAGVPPLRGGAARWAVVGVTRTGAMMIVDALGQTAACPPGQEYDPARWQAEWREQCDLLRDIFGNSFRPPPPVSPAWLGWNNGTISRLAEAAYAERQLPAGTLDVARLTVLADALEEAGCGDAGLLSHLRGPGPHVRGCAVIDALLGKS
jgi:hypothetical protein